MAVNPNEIPSFSDNTFKATGKLVDGLEMLRLLEKIQGKLEELGGEATFNKIVDAIIGEDIIRGKGNLPAGTDLNDIVDNGIYFMNGTSYTNSPVSYGTMLVYKTEAGIVIQQILEFVHGNGYYRRYIATGWQDWESNFDERLHEPVRYKAYGASVMYGAIWVEANGEAVITRADNMDRMPTRIANAIGSTAGYYANYAEGGLPYVRAGGTGRTIKDTVVESITSDTQIVTIGGGRNDGSIPLGNADSVADDGTIIGAILGIKNAIEGVAPLCQIIVVQPTPWARTNDKVFSYQTSGGWSLNSFDEIGAPIFKNNGLGYVNWYDCGAIHKWADYSGAGDNWAHPNNAQMYRQMGNYLAGKISAIYKG